MEINLNLIYKIYAEAFKVRFAEGLIAENYSQGRMRCPTHLSIGQELVPAILSIFNTYEDLAVSTHRGHGHYIGKGGSLIRFFDELHGLESGCSSGHGGSMHLIDSSVGFKGSTAIVGNTIPVGVGLANSQKLEQSKNFTYIFLGDGATEEGVFYESLHYSVVKNLPCFFVIENNEYSVYTNLETRQKNASIESRVKGFNASYSICEAHDFRNLVKIWSESINNLRNNKGPQILEVKTHRYREHCGPNFDDELNYRETEFIKKWETLDILCLLKQDKIFLNQKDLLFGEIENKIKDEITSLFQESINKRDKFFSQFRGTA